MKGGMCEAGGAHINPASSTEASEAGGAHIHPVLCRWEPSVLNKGGGTKELRLASLPVGFVSSEASASQDAIVILSSLPSGVTKRIVLLSSLPSGITARIVSGNRSGEPSTKIVIISFLFQPNECTGSRLRGDASNRGQPPPN